MDPTAPLWDFIVRDGKTIVWRLEEPELTCPCSAGWFGCEWLYQRAPKCTCAAATDDFTTVLHDVACDSVPCPFCPLEADSDLPDNEP